MPGGHLDPQLLFKSLAIAVLTVSDSRDESTDTSGDILAERVAAAGHRVAARAIVKDDRDSIQRQARTWIENPAIDVIISTGGTGLTGRDITPESLRPLFDREMEGFQVVWHMVSYESVGVSTLQSRACAGVAKGTVIFALPGSNGACRDGWDKIIRDQLDSRHRPCSLIGVMPRFMER
jgi:molybdenum cofactor biosynthesis protein B